MSILLRLAAHSHQSQNMIKNMHILGYSHLQFGSHIDFDMIV